MCSRARRRGDARHPPLKPLDEDALLASAAKTGRVVIVQEAPRDARLRRRARGDPGGEGDPRPARPGRARDRLRRAVPVLADRGRVHAVRRARRWTRRGSCSSSEPERLRLWLERGERGFYLRDAATGEPVRWEDPRLRVVPVAGVSFGAEARARPVVRPGAAARRSYPSRRTSTTRTPWRSGTRSERSRSATCRARSRRSFAATSRRTRSGASTAACACWSSRAGAWVGTPR